MSYQDFVTEFGFDLWPKSDRQAGRVGSAMPAWYFDGHIDEEERLVNNQEAVLKQGLIRRENEYSVRKQTEEARAKIDAIRVSFPRPQGQSRDHLASLHKELSEKIADSLFSYTDMNRGTASARDELNRQKNPLINVSRPVARWILYCNGRVVEGSPYRTSRDDATRAWKIAGKILGENTFTEILRPIERPKGARPDMPYFGPTPPAEIMTIPVEEPTVVAMEETPEVVEKSHEPRLCVGCGENIDKEHHRAKRCPKCREKK